MSKIFIKLCGIRSAEDARAAIDAGANAIGVVLYPKAKRCVSLEVAREIAREVPEGVLSFGLFVNQAMEVIRHALEFTGLKGAQLHGQETMQMVGALASHPVLKMVHLTDLPGEWTNSPQNLYSLLLEPAGSTGGTGVANDWEAIRRAKESGVFEGLPPITLAGGLTPENVGGVVRLIKPWGVDVSSGIEGEWGKKSVEKMRKFVEEVRRAE